MKQTIRQIAIYNVAIGEVEYYVIPQEKKLTVVAITPNGINCGVAFFDGVVNYNNIIDIIISYESDKKEQNEKKLSR